VNSVVSFKPVLLATLEKAASARLVFAGDRLVAILVQDEGRSRAQGASGQWSVAAAFGPCSHPDCDGFATLQEASVWVTGRLRQDDQPSSKAVSLRRP
jgi:hypothetical protein